MVRSSNCNATAKAFVEAPIGSKIRRGEGFRRSACGSSQIRIAGVRGIVPAAGMKIPAPNNSALSRSISHGAPSNISTAKPRAMPIEEQGGKSTPT